MDFQAGQALPACLCIMFITSQTDVTGKPSLDSVVKATVVPLLLTWCIVPITA